VKKSKFTNIQVLQGDLRMSDRSINLKNYIVDVPDFPKPGILFKDIAQKLLTSSEALEEVKRQFLAYLNAEKPAKLAALDARGFLFAGLLASDLQAGIVMVRKAGKLPGPVYSETYGLEYRDKDTLEIQQSVIKSGERVAIIDDVLATGGTAAAAVALLKQAKAEVTSFNTVIELADLKGREKLKDIPVHSLMTYEG